MKNNEEQIETLNEKCKQKEEFIELLQYRNNRYVDALEQIGVINNTYPAMYPATDMIKSVIDSTLQPDLRLTLLEIKAIAFDCIGGKNGQQALQDIYSKVNNALKH